MDIGTALALVVTLFLMIPVVILVGWIAWIAWFLLDWDRDIKEELKYGLDWNSWKYKSWKYRHRK